MERISRATQADIVPSVDSLVSKTSMGFCHTFKTQTYNLPDGKILGTKILGSFVEPKTVTYNCFRMGSF